MCVLVCLQKSKLKPVSLYPSATSIVEHQPMKFCLLARANVRVVFVQKDFLIKTCIEETEGDEN